MVARMNPFHLFSSSANQRKNAPAPNGYSGNLKSPPTDASPGTPANSPAAYPPLRASRSPDSLRSPLNDDRKWPSYKAALENKTTTLTFMDDNGVIMKHDLSTKTTTPNDNDDFILVTKDKKKPAAPRRSPPPRPPSPPVRSPDNPAVVPTAAGFTESSDDDVEPHQPALESRIRFRSLGVQIPATPSRSTLERTGTFS